tara:strand:- start:896 stop:1150 length:255 start_codon:yes stop_codon:yes gene_type:complete
LCTFCGSDEKIPKGGKKPKFEVAPGPEKVEVLMKAEDVLKLLEKHEAECSQRYMDIQDKLKSLDNRMWGIMLLIVVAAGLEQLI